jgi:VWA-like domain (DUF2201)
MLCVGEMLGPTRVVQLDLNLRPKGNAESGRQPHQRSPAKQHQLQLRPLQPRPGRVQHSARHSRPHQQRLDDQGNRIAVDCSGSINARQLGLFEAEIRSILEGQRPSQVHVLYFDTEVHRAEVYQAGQPIALTPVGGGGTNFAPCFRWFDERGIVPQTLVFLSDLCGAFPKEAPSYPVL